MSKYDDEDEARSRVSGVQTDYFRLKARGIATLPDGTPLANSAAKHTLHHKRSFDGISKSTTPRTQKVQKNQPMTRSVPRKAFVTPAISQPGTGLDDDILALKARAKALMSEEGTKTRMQKRTLEDADGDLFERAKRVRERMDEDSAWLRKEYERCTGSRSLSQD